MSYNWNYVKEATLAKMDLSAESAIGQGLLNKFPFLANEALTMICSAVKPKYTFATFMVREKSGLLKELVCKYDVSVAGVWQIRDSNGQIDLAFLNTPDFRVDELNETQAAFLTEYSKYKLINDVVKMPTDFVSFGADKSIVVRANSKTEEVFDSDFNYHGYNQLIFFTEGEFHISYNARWFTFSPTTDEAVTLDIPDDIVDCLPAYIASQCLKIDDEQKAAVCRNEWELMLARIDATHYSQNTTLKISGGW